MAFKNAVDTVEPWLDLPIGEKTYRVHAVDIATGILCQNIVTAVGVSQSGQGPSPELAANMRSLILDDSEERDFSRRLLGAAYDEMITDGVAYPHMKRATTTVFAWTVADRDAAERAWNGEPAPGNSQRPAPQDRQRPAAKKTAAKRAPAKKAAPRKRAAAKK